VVVNAGVSGDTTAGGRARLGYALADPNGAPDAAIVELGANDGLRGLPVPQMEKNLEAILWSSRRERFLSAERYEGSRNFGAQYAAEYDAVHALQINMAFCWIRSSSSTSLWNHLWCNLTVSTQMRRA
jgi:acyl-CoA thioesterase-1